MTNLKYSEITEKIIGEAYYIYNHLGYGFLEKVYENALSKRLRDLKFKVDQQTPIKVNFEGVIIGDYFADILVEEKIILELKACEKITSIFEIQLVNYLKATGLEVGLLINFGPKIEIKRKINTKLNE